MENQRGVCIISCHHKVYKFNVMVNDTERELVWGGGSEGDSKLHLGLFEL